MSSDGLQFGRYLLLERIAAGGMGEVYVALQTGIGDFRRPVAVKLLLPHLSDDQQILTMFLREARVASQMQSPHIAQVFDVGFEHERYFIAMELVRGVSLSRLIAGLKAAGRRLEEGALVHVARGLADGLHVAHEQRDPEGKPLGVVHRDVTPHNVLISVDGAVKLTDFGIARVAEGDKFSRPGVVMGKLGYLAPEQLRGQAIDRRVDLFAAGATLYHLAALEKPFETPTGSALEAGRLPLVPLRVCRPDLPRGLVDAIERAMAVDPDARFATARDLRLALPDVVTGIEEQLGALVRTVCGEDVVELDRKTDRASRSHGTDAITRPDRPRPPTAPTAPTAPAAPAPRVAPEPSAPLTLGAARPSRAPLLVAVAGLLVGLASLVVSSTHEGPEARGPAPADAGPAPSPELPDAAVLSPLAGPVPDAGPVGKKRSAQRTARLSIDANPWGQVEVDGRPYGETPIVELELSPGEHQLQVSNPETGKSATQKLRLRAGESRSVRLVLR